MPIYMKYGSIKGRTTTEGFKDWVELNSCQFGAGRGISTAVGKGTNREASAPSLSELVVTKEWDAESSSLFYQEALMGKLSSEVMIKWTTTTADKLDTYLQVKLGLCGISGYSLSSGGDRPSESISLNYGTIEITPYKQEEGHELEKGTVVNYDLTKAKANA